MWYFQRLARLYLEFRKEKQEELWDVRKLHPEFFDWVMGQLVVEHKHPHYIEFSTSMKKLQAKRRILQALTPTGYAWNIFKCDVCKGYHADSPFHVELWKEKELKEAKEDERWNKK